MLQGLSSVWRSLANSWGHSWKRGAVSGTSQLGCTACATMLLTAKAWSQLVSRCTQSSSPASPGSVQGKMPLTSGHQQAINNVVPPPVPKPLYGLCSEGTSLYLLPSRKTEAGFSCCSSCCWTKLTVLSTKSSYFPPLLPLRLLPSWSHVYNHTEVCPFTQLCSKDLC